MQREKNSEFVRIPKIVASSNSKHLAIGTRFWSMLCGSTVARSVAVSLELLSLLHVHHHYRVHHRHHHRRQSTRRKRPRRKPPAARRLALLGTLRPIGIHSSIRVGGERWGVPSHGRLVAEADGRVRALRKRAWDGAGWQRAWAVAECRRRALSEVLLLTDQLSAPKLVHRLMIKRAC